MEIRKYFRGETTYEFVCECWQTSYAWGHKVNMFRNGLEYNSTKVRYWNRTWEKWTYQSAISQVIWLEIEKVSKNLIEDYKYRNNIKRLSSKKKEELIAENQRIKELTELRTAVNNGQRSGEF